MAKIRVHNNYSLLECWLMYHLNVSLNHKMAWGYCEKPGSMGMAQNSGHCTYAFSKSPSIKELRVEYLSGWSSHWSSILYLVPFLQSYTLNKVTHFVCSCTISAAINLYVFYFIIRVISCNCNKLVLLK